MIPSLIASYPWITPALLVIWQTIELYLGFKKPMDAGSVPQLLYRLLQRIFSKKTNDLKGASTMANPNAITISVTVDGPTWTAGGTIVDAAKKFEAGEKPPQILQEELGPLLGQMAALALIPADFAGDPATVLNAAALRTVELEEIIRLAKKTAPTPK